MSKQACSFAIGCPSCQTPRNSSTAEISCSNIQCSSAEGTGTFYERMSRAHGIQKHVLSPEIRLTPSASTMCMYNCELSCVTLQCLAVLSWVRRPPCPYDLKARKRKAVLGSFCLPSPAAACQPACSADWHGHNQMRTVAPLPAPTSTQSDLSSRLDAMCCGIEGTLAVS